MTLRVLGDLLLLAWAVPAIGAAIEYLFVRDEDGRRLGFRRSSMGWHLESYMAALALMGALGIVRLVLDDNAFWAGLRVAVFALGVIPVTWWRWAVVHRARVDSDAAHRRRTAATETPPDRAP